MAEQKGEGTHLVELVAEVDGVDVVALEVGEHDDLRVRIREEAYFGRCVGVFVMMILGIRQSLCATAGV